MTEFSSQWHGDWDRNQSAMTGCSPRCSKGLFDRIKSPGDLSSLQTALGSFGNFWQRTWTAA